MESPKNIQIGRIGEDIAVKFLKNRGFTIIERNFWRKWGEIDVICETNGVIHFVEVKSVSQEEYLQYLEDGHRPEDNLHSNKAKRLRRVIETYIEEKSVDSDYVVDLITIRLDKVNYTAHVEILEDIII